MKNFYRSGDHSFHPISELPQNLTEVKHNGSFVFGVGEASNHNHVLQVADRKELKVYKDEQGRFYFKVDAPAQAMHVVGDSKTQADHKPITIAPGIYRQTYEREVDIFSKVVRKVID